MLRGVAVGGEDIGGLSAVTLWRLRNAPYARHGRKFVSPDLQTFYYANDKLPQLHVDPAFKDRMLTNVDDANVQLVSAAQNGENVENAEMEDMSELERDANPCGGGGNPCGGMSGGGNPCGTSGGGPSSDPTIADPQLVELCFVRWAGQSSPKVADTQRCADFFATLDLGGPEVWKLTGAELSAISNRIDDCKACGHVREAHDYLHKAAVSHWELFDKYANRSIEPVLDKLLTGKRITADELKGFASVTLWRLRNAPYARRGRPFKSPDLQKFFYDNLEKGLKPNPAFKDSMLDKIDEQNVAVVVGEIKRRGEP
jgi:hypothetical protein